MGVVDFGTGKGADSRTLQTQKNHAKNVFVLKKYIKNDNFLVFSYYLYCFLLFLLKLRLLDVADGKASSSSADQVNNYLLFHTTFRLSQFLKCSINLWYKRRVFWKN